jgi:hypothetical protein
MKKLIFISMILFSIPLIQNNKLLGSNSPTEIQSSFCDGWANGYVAGWMYAKPNSYKPFIPFCPFPEPGKDSYQDGYNRGFVQGLSDNR